MTNKNSSLICEPFLLKPAAKDYLWGGRRLNDDFSKNIDMHPLAETWECSTHPDGPSVIASGEYEGQTLSSLTEKHPEILGTHAGDSKGIPILVKLIDAQSNLSVQVHPDDLYAKENENGQLGKTEMWYVLDASKDASLIYGLHHTVDREAFEKSIHDGTVEKYLQKVPIRTGDVFFIQPGTIHAIGAGALIAEIQESSNLTYRLYDYGRKDKNGKMRELHIKKGLDVACLDEMPEPKQPIHVFQFKKGCAVESICRCQYFCVDRILLNTERIREMARFRTGPLSFSVFLCTDGCGVVMFGEKSIPFFKGDCLFVPANSCLFHIHGKAQLLKIEC